MPWLPSVQIAPWANSLMNSTTSSCGSESISESLAVEPKPSDGSFERGAISRNSFSWTFLSLPCLMMPPSLDPICAWHLSIRFAKETHPLYYKACSASQSPVLLCTIYKACTKYFPILLSTTRFAQRTAQSTSQHYFVPLPSTKRHLDKASAVVANCKLQAWIIKHNGSPHRRRGALHAQNRGSGAISDPNTNM